MLTGKWAIHTVKAGVIFWGKRGLVIWRTGKTYIVIEPRKVNVLEYRRKPSTDSRACRYSKRYLRDLVCYSHPWDKPIFGRVMIRLSQNMSYRLKYISRYGDWGMSDSGHSGAVWYAGFVLRVAICNTVMAQPVYTDYRESWKFVLK